MTLTYSSYLKLDQLLALQQPLSQLAWFDEIYLQNDPVIRGLVEKGRGYSVDDQEALRAKHQEFEF